MRASLLFRLCGLWLLLACAPAFAQAPAAAIPPLDAPVVDTTGTLDPATVQRLDAQARALQQRKGSQLQVLVVASTRPESIEQYAVRVFEAWRLGRAGVDDGVLLLVAKDDRTVRIETGYGLEGAIPDAVANRVIQEYLVPKFRNGDFDGGIEDATTVLVKLVDGEPLPAPVSRNTPRDSRDTALGAALFLPALFVAFVVAQVARGLFGRLPLGVRGLLTAIAAGAAAWLVSSLVLAGLAGAVLGALVGMVSFGGGRYVGRGGSDWGDWGGGFGGMGGMGGIGRGAGRGMGGGRRSGGFGGGGGWSGGGGRSGGGGASGRW